jgi:tRNA pseudouridine38-40 synthase
MANPVSRWALGLSYAGNAYDGWQTQPTGRAVEDHVKRALSQFMDEPCGTLVAAGRTDAGVHATGQVLHFDTALDREPFAWVRGPNRYLPRDIAIEWSRSVPSDFHARFAATSRRYVYVLRESATRPSLEQGRVGWVFKPLNQVAMQAAANHLLGTHDFSSFRAAQCQARTPVRTLMRANVSRKGAYWRFEFEGDAFLHHMIRNIMGCLVAVGQGLRPADWMAEVLAAKSRQAAAPTFAPDGLYFVGPRYPERFGLPETTPTLDWLP